MNDKLIIEKYLYLKSTVKVANDLQISPERVRRCLIKNNIPRVGWKPYSKKKLNRTTKRRFVTDEEISFMVDNMNSMSYREIAEMLDRPLSTVSETLRRKGYIGKKQGVCSICGEFFTGDKRKEYCSKKCKDISCRKSRDANRYVLRKSRKIIVDKGISLIKLYNRDFGICYICGCKTDFNDKKLSVRGNVICGEKYPSIDHVIPLSKGGLHSWDNVKLACLHCNLSKQDKIYEGGDTYAEI